MQSKRIERVLKQQRKRRLLDGLVGVTLAIWLGALGYSLHHSTAGTAPSQAQPTAIASAR